MLKRRLEPQVVYTVGELARLLGWTRFRVTRLLRKRDVKTTRFGERSAELVPLVAFKDAFPEVWASIVMKHGLTISACDAKCPVCGSTVKITEAA